MRDNIDDLKKAIENFYLTHMPDNEVHNITDNTSVVEGNISETYRIAYEQGFRHGKEKYERPHGEWSITDETDEFYGRVYKCTYCGKEMLACGCRNFCTWCGADMRGKKE